MRPSCTDYSSGIGVSLSHLVKKKENGCHVARTYVGRSNDGASPAREHAVVGIGETVADGAIANTLLALLELLKQLEVAWYYKRNNKISAKRPCWLGIVWNRTLDASLGHCVDQLILYVGQLVNLLCAEKNEKCGSMPSMQK